MTGTGPTPTRSHGAGRRADRPALRVGLLGLNAWVVALLIPTLHVGFGDAAASALLVLPLALLALGLAWLDAAPSRAQLALLVGFAPAVCLAIGARPALVEREAYDPLAILVAAASLLAFLGAAAQAITRSRTPRPTTQHPSRDREPVAEPRRRRWTRHLLLSLASLGALAIAVLAPSRADRAERAAAWEGAADDGAVLTAVVASLVAALALGGVVGPGLRARRGAAPSPARARRRVLLSLLAAAVTGLGWLALSGLETR